MARFYASDVVYKDYADPRDRRRAARRRDRDRRARTGETIEAGQFLPDLQWLTPASSPRKLGAQCATPSAARPAPGLHGHSLDSVSVGGTTLQTGSTNTIPASPPPTFTLHFTNGGQNNETNVVCKVTVSGTSDQRPDGRPADDARAATRPATSRSASPPPTGTSR